MGTRVFQIAQDKIQLVFHLEEDRVTASTHEYIKPQSDGKNMTPVQVKTFQVNPLATVPKRQYFHNNLIKLQRAENKCHQAVTNSMRETADILKLRAREEHNIQLAVSFYDTVRNQSGRALRDENENKKEEETGDAVEIDYLAPFLAQLDDDRAELSFEEAQQVREECLKDLKQRLIEKANLIQSRFDQETDELQQRQLWYQQNQTTLEANEEAEYVAYCNDAMFRIHILEQRLNRHKEVAPRRYVELDQRLRKDPRLIHLHSD